MGSIGHDPASEVLEVEFLNGSIDQYSDVPPSAHNGLMAVASHGSYLPQSVQGHFG
ncbi:KTSC domain-containing protein [Brevundimonas sp.]|uniref:KTSC domain-containing protein n=1 Tax=Brevundimonas sp. TaxID=1871086 RepID=UPI0034585875